MSLHDAVKVALFIDSDTVLLQHRDKDAPTNPGKYTFFGGSVEEGETVATAVSRELREETSIEFQDSDLNYVASFKRSGGGVMYVYALKLTSDEFEVYEGQGKQAMRVSDVHAHPSVTEGTKEAVKYLLEKIGKE